MKNKLIILLGAIFLAGCGSSNTDKGSPQEAAQSVTKRSGPKGSLSDPKVNVLFVVDNSNSMMGYQQKMAKNMRLFSDRFFANSRIDYRIGIVPIYDSKYLNDKTVYSKSGVRKMNALAELVPLKGLAPEDNPNQLYITRATINPKQVLEQSVMIGTQWGPEAEESFSPVLAIANEDINEKKNQGFYDKDAYLAVIFLTDADDVSPGVSGEDFYQRLIKLKGDRSKIFIAAALPNLKNISATCTTDGHGPIQAFPSLLAASGAIFADLCSDTFGSRLADFANYLVQRIGTQVVDLNFIPDITSLQVTYGPANSDESERIQVPRGANGYIFDTERNQVIISPDFSAVGKDDWIIFVKAKPVNLSNYKTPRLRRL